MFNSQCINKNINYMKYLEKHIDKYTSEPIFDGKGLSCKPDKVKGKTHSEMHFFCIKKKCHRAKLKHSATEERACTFPRSFCMIRPVFNRYITCLYS